MALANRCQSVPDEASLTKSFVEAYKEVDEEYPNFGGGIISQQSWWDRVVQRTFEMADFFSLHGEISAVADDLFKHFATTEAWELYPEVIPTLKALKNVENPPRIAVISNWDQRLGSVLFRLGVAELVDVIAPTVLFKETKPDIFMGMPDRLGFAPEDCLHIGDSLRRDYNGATSAGMNALWLQRQTKDAKTLPWRDGSMDKKDLPPVDNIIGSLDEVLLSPLWTGAPKRAE